MKKLILAAFFSLALSVSAVYASGTSKDLAPTKDHFQMMEVSQLSSLMLNNLTQAWRSAFQLSSSLGFRHALRKHSYSPN